MNDVISLLPGVLLLVSIAAAGGAVAVSRSGSRARLPRVRALLLGSILAGAASLAAYAGIRGELDVWDFYATFIWIAVIPIAISAIWLFRLEAPVPAARERSLAREGSARRDSLHV